MVAAHHQQAALKLLVDLLLEWGGGRKGEWERKVGSRNWKWKGGSEREGWRVEVKKGGWEGKEEIGRGKERGGGGGGSRKENGIG